MWGRGLLKEIACNRLAIKANKLKCGLLRFYIRQIFDFSKDFHFKFSKVIGEEVCDGNFKGMGKRGQVNSKDTALSSLIKGDSPLVS